jgi:hypothetical protein
VQAGLAGSEAKRGDEQRQWRGLKMKWSRWAGFRWNEEGKWRLQSLEKKNPVFDNYKI